MAQQSHQYMERILGQIRDLDSVYKVQADSSGDIFLITNTEVSMCLDGEKIVGILGSGWKTDSIKSGGFWVRDNCFWSHIIERAD